MKLNEIYQGDTLEVLKTWPSNFVHCFVTSPPYFGLRDYGVHGQMGLEKTPEEYVDKMVSVFREVKRTLHPSGTLWLNLGDSYGGSWQNYGGENKHKNRHQPTKEIPPTAYCIAKNLLMMPSRVALALQADGWYLRSMMPWLKRNAMPESVDDRPATSLEYVFLLSKSKIYFYDAEAIKIPASPNTNPRNSQGVGKRPNGYLKDDGRLSKRKNNSSMEAALQDIVSSRNFRNSDFFFQSWQGLLQDEAGDPLAFVVNPKGYKEAHFATFPEKLVEPCIKAGTSEKGCCPGCGAPWERIVEIRGGTTGKSWHDHSEDLAQGKRQADGTKLREGWSELKTRTIGWRPTCSCGKEETVPCIVADNFSGAGTTAKVAYELRRDYLGIELNPDYIKMTYKRIANTTRNLI